MENIKKAIEILPVINALWDEGILRIGGSSNNIQCEEKYFREHFPEYTVKKRNSVEYPYELSTLVDGVLILTISEVE